MYSSLNVLIGGGTGFVGRHLVDCLKGCGAKVRVVSRKQSLLLDRLSWESIKEEGIPEDVNAVVNLAGRNILDMVPWTESYKKEVYDSRIDTNRIFAEAIKSAKIKPKCFVTISGVGYYEPHESTIYNEEWTQPENGKAKDDFLMRLARDWEKAGELDEKSVPSTRRVVIRSGVVIGPNGGIIKNLKPQFSLGVGSTMGDGNQWFPWIHVDDLVNLIQFAITNEHVTGIVNGVAPESSAKNKDFAKALAAVLNRPMLLKTPEFVVNLLFGRERGNILLKGPCVRTKSETLGFRYKYPTLVGACKASI